MKMKRILVLSIILSLLLPSLVLASNIDSKIEIIKFYDNPELIADEYIKTLNSILKEEIQYEEKEFEKIQKAFNDKWYDLGLIKEEDIEIKELEKEVYEFYELNREVPLFRIKHLLESLIIILMSKVIN